MLLKLVVGDLYGDGHGKSDTYIVEISNKGKCIPDISKAYKSGVKNAGLDITKFCSEYEDSYVPKKVVTFCKENNIKLEVYDPKRDESPYIWSKDYVNIWIAIFNKNKYNLHAELLDVKSLEIGGYGLL